MRPWRAEMLPCWAVRRRGAGCRGLACRLDEDEDLGFRFGAAVLPGGGMGSGWPDGWGGAWGLGDSQELADALMGLGGLAGWGLGSG